MKAFIPFSLSIMIFLVALSSCDNKQNTTDASIKSFEDSVAYAVGMDIAKFYQKQGVSLDPKLIYAGMTGMLEGKPDISVKEALDVVGRFQQSQLQLSLANAKIAGERYLNENATKEGIRILPSGLQYKVVEAGKGKRPQLKDKVKVSYKGKFVDGTIFTDTDQEGGPVEAIVDQLLPGWTEALLMMMEGDTWVITLPHELAYGTQGFINPDNGQMAIPPYSTLIYEISLIEVL
ncbi:MAG: FKBP-type peptidyl-prolyl cis-trans isomerase [Bacteroidia bacterium]|nr:FKBP-type peptidyl-prolyl cis-trans isomerase [Bacteroidia bacterium]